MTSVDRTGGPPPPSSPSPDGANSRNGRGEGFSSALEAQREPQAESVFARRRPEADVSRFTEIEDVQELERARRAGRDIAPRRRDREKRSPFDDASFDDADDELDDEAAEG